MLKHIWELVVVFGLLAVLLLPGLFFAGTLFGFFGALAGIVHPPRNRFWARLQKLGFVLLSSGRLCWLAAYVASRMALTSTIWWSLVASGAGLLMTYLFVGNACRRYYETSREDHS